MNLPGTSIGSTPMGGASRRRRTGSSQARGFGLPEDIQLGSSIQDKALDAAENARRARLTGQLGMGAEQGRAARADYAELANRLFGSPDAIAARRGEVAQRLMGNAPAAPVSGSPLDARLAAVGQRQLQAAATQGGQQVARAEEMSAIDRLLTQIGVRQEDRGRQFTNRSNMDRARTVEDAFNLQGKLALGEALRQTGLGKRTASIEAGAGQAERTRMEIAERREQQLYDRRMQMEMQALEAKQQRDQAILAQIDGFLASIGAR